MLSSAFSCLSKKIKLAFSLASLVLCWLVDYSVRSLAASCQVNTCADYQKLNSWFFVYHVIGYASPIVL